MHKQCCQTTGILIIQLGACVLRNDRSICRLVVYGSGIANMGDISMANSTILTGITKYIQCTLVQLKIPELQIDVHTYCGPNIIMVRSSYDSVSFLYPKQCIP